MRATAAVAPRALSGVLDTVLQVVNTGASAYSQVRTADAAARDARANLAATLETIKQNNAALVAAATPAKQSINVGPQPAPSGGSLANYVGPALVGLALLVVGAVALRGRRQ